MPAQAQTLNLVGLSDTSVTVPRAKHASVNGVVGYNFFYFLNDCTTSCALPTGFFAGVNSTGHVGFVAELDANTKNSEWLWSALAGVRFTGHGGAFGEIMGGAGHLPGIYLLAIAPGAGADIGHGPVRLRIQGSVLILYRDRRVGPGVSDRRRRLVRRLADIGWGQMRVRVAAAALVLLPALGAAPAMQARRTPAPEFEFVTRDGEHLSSRDLRGSVVLLDFWGTWCGPCRSATPDLVKLHRKFVSDAADGHLVIISVAENEKSEGAWSSYIDKAGMIWPTVPGQAEAHGAPVRRLGVPDLHRDRGRRDDARSDEGLLIVDGRHDHARRRERFEGSGQRFRSVARARPAFTRPRRSENVLRGSGRFQGL